MLYALFIALVATAICCSTITSAQQQPPCGVNEARYPCGKSCEERCNASLPAYCRGIKCAPPFGCRCKNGYARSPLTEQCVPVNECPKKCAKHEVLGTCGRICEGTCTEPFQPEICQRIDCRGVECRCDLARGYVRNEKTGECVAKDKC